jgi:hypothetical protein
LNKTKGCLIANFATVPPELSCIQLRHLGEVIFTQGFRDRQPGFLFIAAQLFAFTPQQFFITQRQQIA